MKCFFYSVLFCFISVKTWGQQDVVNLKEILKTTANNTQKQELLLKISSDYLSEQRNIDSATVYIRKLEMLSAFKSDSLLISEVYFLKAQIEYLESDYESTTRMTNEALRLFEKLEVSDRTSAALTLLGNTHQVLFKNKQSIAYFLKALVSATEKQKVEIFVGLGAVNTQANNLDSAISYYNKAFELSTTRNEDKYLYNIHNGLATIYLKQNETEKALQLLEKALKVAIKREDLVAQVICYHNIGYNYAQIENFEMAIDYYKQALPIFKQITNKHAMATVYMHFAEALMAIDDLDLAEVNLSKADTLFKELKNTGRASKILNIKAQIQRKKGKLLESVELLNQAIDLSEKNEITGIMMLNYLELSKTQSKLHNYKESLIAFQRYNAITDSITKRTQRQEIAEMQARFGIKTYEHELRVKDKELLLIEQKKTTSTYQIALMGLLIIGLLFFIYRQRKINRAKRVIMEAERKLIGLRQKELHTEMNFKNTEIADFALHINERNKLLQSFDDKIRNIKEEASREVKRQLSELQHFINTHLDANKEKVILNAKVEETQESFNYKLKENNANLSPKEVQVATYLRLNMPSKQIAAQMRIGEQSVNNYRRSIRKKFELTKETNLSAFLQKL